LKSARQALASQLVSRNAVDRFTFQFNGSCADTLKARQDVDECGFSGAVGADQSRDASPRHGQRDAR
jgi:hypothetical protein